jgi:hypothetical protein
LNAIDIGLAPDPCNAMNDISTMNKVVEYMALGKLNRPEFVGDHQLK